MGDIKQNHEERVKVVIRCRPMSEDEINKDRKQIVSVSQDKGKISVTNPKKDDQELAKVYVFDATFDQESQQESIYNHTGYSIVESVLEGYNGTIFAYGQTGTGKTHTMVGIPNDQMNKGIIPRAFEHIFKAISGTPDAQFLIRASYLQIYKEEICDLLNENNQKLDIRVKDGNEIYVKGLSQFNCQNEHELYGLLNKGSRNRKVGRTDMNSVSSRSHSIFTVTIERCNIGNEQNSVRVGKLHLVDLAGSERQSKTGATGQLLEEAITINQSLTTLGNVIQSLTDPKATHIPYRDSKLTRLLQDSLGGNTKTVMIVNIGPADYNYDETISTLRYAQRAKSIKTHAVINENPKDAMIKQYQQEIELLKSQLNSSIDISSQHNETIKVVKIIEVIDDERLNQLQEQLKIERMEGIKKLNDELLHIQEDKEIQESQKEQLVNILKEKEKMEKEQQEKQQNIIDKLNKLRQSVVKGDQMMKSVIEKEKKIILSQLEIEKKIENERLLEDQFKENEERVLLLDKKYKSSNEENEDKTFRLQTLIKRYKQIQLENKELDDSYFQDIEDSQDQNRILYKELKRKRKILYHFIPDSIIQLLNERAVYDNNIDNWVYPNLHLAGNRIQREQQSNHQNSSYHQQEDVSYLLQLEENGIQNNYLGYSEDGYLRQTDQTQQNSTDQISRLKQIKKQKRKRSKEEQKKLQKQSKIQSQNCQNPIIYGQKNLKVHL